MAERILVVEDNGDSRMIISALLERAGYEIVQAAGGEEGVKSAIAETPDLILLDVNMPHVDGFEVCSRLKSDTRTADIPIIFLTAKAESSDKVRGLDAGGADYIIKPFQSAEVLARVRTQLKMRALLQSVSNANKELSQKQQHLAEDLKAAAEIQRSFLPRKAPESGAIEFSWRFIPCEYVAGDIFNIVEFSPYSFAAYVLDVAGHGVPAAMVTASIAQSLQPSQLRPTDSPAQVLQMLEREFPMERFDRYASIVYLKIDLCAGTLTYSNAGHPPPVLLHADREFELLSTGGTLIGMGGVAPFEEETKRLRPGDKLILYTDGIATQENIHGELFGEERLYNLFEDLKEKPLHVLLNRVTQALSEHCGCVKLCDDVSILAAEVKVLADIGGQLCR